MHISEQVAAELTAQGFTARESAAWQIFTGRNGTSGGAFNRPVIVTVRIDPTGRWLERVDGWGNVERDVDLRDYAGRAAAAVDHVLE